MLEQIKKGVLLDVRTAEEYAQRHADGSRLVPLDKLATTDLGLAKDTPIFVHCEKGGRAEQAAMILREQGYATVTNVGGLADLEALGLLKL